MDALSAVLAALIFTTPYHDATTTVANEAPRGAFGLPNPLAKDPSSADPTIAPLFTEQKVSRLQITGWADMGYTAATSGPGQLAVAPEVNRYGNEFLLNQITLNAYRPTHPDELSFGYRLQMMGGADATTLQGPGDIQNTNTHFGAQVRQVNLQAHVPVFWENGLDVVVGRRASLMGYESYMPVYRQFYSLTYQWWYAQDGADTGCWFTAHPDKQMDVTFGVTLGSNTFFTQRAGSPCYVVQAKRWLNDEHTLYREATFLIGDQSVGKQIAAYPGNLATVVEYSIQYAPTSTWTQVFQLNAGWDQQTPTGIGHWYGLLEQSVFHIHPRFDLQGRIEWFDDVNGTRTGHWTNYFDFTGGLAIRAARSLQVRPELRMDTAGAPAFGPVGSTNLSNAQFTTAVEALVTF